MKQLLQILLVEDSDADEKLLVRALRQDGYELAVRRVETREEMQTALHDRKWDAIVSDYHLPTFSGPSALALVKEMDLDLPFIIVSGMVGEVNAVAAMKAGAHDYVMKDNLTRLGPAIAREIQDAEVRRERRQADFEREKMREENERLLREIASAALQQRAFLRDILFAVTEGKLLLCDGAGDLPVTGQNTVGPIPVLAESMRMVRVQTEEAAASLSFPSERSMDLVTAVGEATMNAIVHGGGGHAHIHAGSDCIHVVIADQGKGIDIRSLPRATLERGYTTGGSLGHGFFMMLSFVDRVYLLTGPSGTTVVLEQHKTIPEPVWLSQVG